MQATGRHHRQIRKVLSGVPQHIFHTPRAFHPRQRVLHSDANLRQLSVLLLLLRRQFLAARFFFGWQVRRTRGSYPWKPLSFSRVDWRGERGPPPPAALLSCVFPPLAVPTVLSPLLLSVSS